MREKIKKLVVFSAIALIVLSIVTTKTPEPNNSNQRGFTKIAYADGEILEDTSKEVDPGYGTNGGGFIEWILGQPLDSLLGFD